LDEVRGFDRNQFGNVGGLFWVGDELRQMRCRFAEGGELCRTCAYGLSTLKVSSVAVISGRVLVWGAVDLGSISLLRAEYCVWLPFGVWFWWPFGGWWLVAFRHAFRRWWPFGVLFD